MATVTELLSKINKRLIQDPEKLKRVIYNSIVRANPEFGGIDVNHIGLSVVYFTMDRENQPTSTRQNYTLSVIVRVLPEHEDKYDGSTRQWNFRYVRSPYGEDVFRELGLQEIVDDKRVLSEAELRELMLTLRDKCGIVLNSTGVYYPSNYTGYKYNRSFSIIHTGTSGYTQPAGMVFNNRADYRQRPDKAINYINNSRWWSFKFNTSYRATIRSDQM